MKTILSILIICLISSLAVAQKNVPYAWIEGAWEGDGFGGSSEEVWSGPSNDGMMMGSYRHFKADGSINFYEFLLLDSTGLKLKHFDKDLIGWEEKEKSLFFEMIEYTEDKIILKGLIFERVSDTEMKIYLKMNTKQGKRTEIFSMKRK